ELYGFDESRVEIVPNGINKSYLEKKAPAYQKTEKVIITYLNRMLWYKGIQNVIAALAKRKKSKEKVSEFEFWIMGRPAKYTEVLKKLVSENDLENEIKFVFSPSDEQRDEAFLKSQINVLASKWEATGIALIEAMAKG